MTNRLSPNMALSYYDITIPVNMHFTLNGIAKTDNRGRLDGSKALLNVREGGFTPFTS